MCFPAGSLLVGAASTQWCPPAAGAAGAVLGLEGADGRHGGASLQHGVAVAAVGVLAGGLGPWRWLQTVAQPHTPHLQHLVEHRQQQDH